jgi:signal transduction histidine kinase
MLRVDRLRRTEVQMAHAAEENGAEVRHTGPSDDRLGRLAGEHAAVRRVATLVAAGEPASELFATVVQEIVEVLDVPRGWMFRFEPDRSVFVLASVNYPDCPVGIRIPLDGPSVAAMVLDTGRPARIEDFADLPGTIATRARNTGVRSAFGVPIKVDGTVWGMIGVGPTEERPLPADTEARLHDFTELVASAIASVESSDRLRHLAERQASLRQIATLVAEGAPLAELFAVAAEQIVRVLDVSAMALFRFDRDRTSTVVTSMNAPMFPIGSHWPLDGHSLSATVFETGRTARIDDYAELTGTIAAGVRESGLGSSVGLPVVVNGRVWGMSCVGTTGNQPLPAGIEAELHDFSELVAIAISNAESRDRLRRLAVQQASLRRIATRVAEGAAPAELFAAVAQEVAGVLGVSSVNVVRFEPDNTSVVVSSFNDPGFPVGSRWPLDGPSLNATVFETGRPARVDNYPDLPGPVAAAAGASGVRFGVGVPIIVDGSVWGMVAVGRRRRREALLDYGGSYSGQIVLASESAQEIEARLAAFTEIVATAISKAQAHDDLRQLAQEQAALRHVATLVAEAAAPDEIFAAVVDEVATILGLQGIELVRFGADGTATVIGASGAHPFPAGSCWRLGDPSIMTAVFRTGASARIDDYRSLPGTLAQVALSAGFCSSIGAPIVVGGRTWGAIVAFSLLPDAISERSERRLNEFTELVATAVSNATARADLIASRARIVAAGDEARRRLERNLHDGTQQRLIAVGLDLQRLRATIPENQHALQAGLEAAERDLVSVLEEVRELSRGLHPAQLSRSGLGAALRALGRKSPIPVDIEVNVEPRPPASIETAVYYVISEAITNAIKHSRASAISVTVARKDAVMHAAVADDGIGGAVAEDGSGLTGLNDRVEALGGRFSLDSPREHGTTISIELPILRSAAP